MPAQRPHTGAARPRYLARGAAGGARQPSQGRGHAAQNRSASLREPAGRPPRRPKGDDEVMSDSPSSPPVHTVYDDAQQREQQIEQVLATLSNEERQIFQLMSSLLVRQPLVQAHRVLACLAYQSETRRYLAQYGGVVSGAGATQDEDEDLEGKANLLRELETYHAKATARLEATAERDAREARRADWVRANLDHKKKKQQQNDAATRKREAKRTASSGRAPTPARHERKPHGSTSPTAAHTRPTGVLPLAALRTPSASSVTSSQASTRSPQGKAPAATTPTRHSPPRPQQPSPLAHTQAPQLSATPPRGEQDDATAAPAATAWSPSSAQHGEQELTLQTTLPLPAQTASPAAAAAGPSAPQPSVSSHSIEADVRVPQTEQDAPVDENITRWLFTEQSAPATHAHQPAAGAPDMDDLFGTGAASTPVKAEAAAAVEEEEGMFIPGAPLGAHGAAVPMDEPLEAVPDTEELKMPWDDI